MTFGQPSGLPAPARLVQELLGLAQEAGHRDFRDARGPMGLTQRQAAGKFTHDEATELIARLQEAGAADGPPAPIGRPPTLSAGELAMRRLPDEQLAAELKRRGWIVVEP